MKTIRELIVRLVFFMVLSVAGAHSLAQDFPAKPVRFIVPYPAGGGADVTARLFISGLSERMGRQLVIENRGGAGAIIGAELVARAAPDGYTLLMAAANLAMSVSLFSKLRFDPTKDFTAVTLLANTPSIVAVHPSLPVKSIPELIALAKAAPGKIDYAGGNGSTLQFAAELFNVMAKINLHHVPYNGGGPALIAVLSGEVPVIIAPGALVPYVRSGKLRGIAITGSKRSAALPDLPTVAESGLPGYVFNQWYGVLAPAGTPDQIITRLNSDFVTAVQTPEVRARLLDEASDPVGSTPGEFAAHLKLEIEKWAKLVKIAKIHVE